MFLTFIVRKMHAMESVREYRLLPAGLAGAQQRMTNRYLVPQLLIVALGVVISAVLAMRGAGLGAVVTSSIVIGLFITYMSFVAPRRVRRSLVKCWDTYVLTIGPDYLLRRQADSPDIRLSFTDVKQIEHLPGRYLRVIGNARYQVIGIPESIENFEEVLATVSRIAPATNRKTDRSLRNALWMAGGFAAYMVMLWARSPKIVIPLAIIVSGLLLWLFWFMQTSPNVLRKAKRTSWIYLGVVLLCILRVLVLFDHAK
ncbi:MAG TPA: hypothetical protein VGG04_04975 [Candidatus Sulfotelmatobacter sp.]